MKSNSKASAKYNLNNYERIEITVVKGDKSKIKAYAEEKGMSTNELIKTAITNYTGIELPNVSDKKG